MRSLVQWALMPQATATRHMTVPKWLSTGQASATLHWRPPNGKLRKQGEQRFCSPSTTISAGPSSEGPASTMLAVSIDAFVELIDTGSEDRFRYQHQPVPTGSDFVRLMARDFFDGTIDDVVVADRPLLPVEVILLSRNSADSRIMLARASISAWVSSAFESKPRRKEELPGRGSGKA